MVEVVGTFVVLTAGIDQMGLVMYHDANRQAFIVAGATQEVEESLLQQRMARRSFDIRR